MKSLLIFLIPVFFSAHARGPITAFKSAFEWRYGQVNSISGTGDTVFFTSGRILISADISSKDTLLELGSLDLGEETGYSVYLQNRLYLMGEHLFILDVTNPENPVLLSKTKIRRGYRPKVVISGTAAYILSDSEMDVLNLSDELNPTLTDSLKSGFNDMATVSGKLFLSRKSEILVASLENPLHPVITDKILLDSLQSGALLTDLGHHLIAVLPGREIRMYSPDSDGRFQLTQSFPYRGSSEKIRKCGSILGIFNAQRVGLTLQQVDFSDPARPVFLHPAACIQSSGDFYRAPNHLLVCNATSGLVDYGPPNLEPVRKAVYYGGNFMVNPELKKNLLIIPELQGFQIFQLEKGKKPGLRFFYDEGLSDVTGEGITRAVVSDSLLFLIRSESVSVRKMNPSCTVLGTLEPAGGFQTVADLAIQDSVLIRLDRIQGMGMMYQYPLREGKLPVRDETAGFESNTPVSKIAFSGNRLFLVLPSEGIRFTLFPFSPDSDPILSEPFAAGEKPEAIYFYQDLIFIYGDSGISLWKESSPGVFNKLSGFSLDHPLADITFSGHRLFLTQYDPAEQFLYSKSVWAYTFKNPEKPELETRADFSIPVTGIAADETRLVVTHGYSGFTVYDKITEPADVDEPDTRHPAQFSLLPACPNPFNPETRIPFTLPGTGTVTFEVYSVLGQKVNSVSVTAEAGLNSVGLTLDGQASGMYLVKGIWQGRQVTQRILLVK